MTADDHTLPVPLPLFLNRGQAATYVGVSIDTFAAEVAAELWPPPVRRGDSGRRLTWYRPALDAAAAQLAASASAEGPAPPAPVDASPAPPATRVSPEKVQALREKIDAARKNGSQRRHEKAA